jgi:alpha-beta hydrolase superfamily lysophospholipase
VGTGGRRQSSVYTARASAAGMHRVRTVGILGVRIRMIALRTGRSTGRRVAVAVAVTMVVAATVGSVAVLSASASASTLPAPKGLPSFYSVPNPLPSTVAGTLIKSQKLASGDLHGTVYRVMYVSKSLQNKAVPVTGLVVVPRMAPPAGGYKVVTWSHGTNGMADQCAPSLDPTQDVPLANQLLDQGWEVTASDYQGEGTPGLMQYLVGVTSARNTIDIVRAAQKLPQAHVSKNYVVWGHSEGGQTAMFALDIGTSYAPDLKLDGVVAGAPPSQFGLIYDFLLTSPYRFYLFMAAGGFNAGYGNKAAPLPAVLTPEAMRLLPDLEKGCSGYLQRTLDKYPIKSLVKANPYDIPAWKLVLQANDPANFTTPSSAPLLILQGGNDEQIPVISTQLLATHSCSIGQATQRWIYPGQSHAGVIPVYMPDMIGWINDRFSSNPGAFSSYVPSGEPGVQTSSCAA